MAEARITAAIEIEGGVTMARRTQEDRSDAAIRKALKAALTLFSRNGYRATSMRQIAKRSGLSVGNLYHHFGGKEELFRRLIDQYWAVLTDPELPLNRIFAAHRFPDDLEDLAAAIASVVESNSTSILLIYIDVIEFKGKHIHEFYRRMAERFSSVYEEDLEARQERGELGAPSPLFGVMMATRWFFYYFTVEKCFGVPEHLGLDSQAAVAEFCRILRLGLLPRQGETSLLVPASKPQSKALSKTAAEPARARTAPSAKKPGG